MKKNPKSPKKTKCYVCRKEIDPPNWYCSKECEDNRSPNSSTLIFYDKM